MHVAVHRLLAGLLKAANNILPDPNGKPRPLTEAQKAIRRDSAVPHITREKPLTYTIPLLDLSRIFHLNSENTYQEDVGSKGLEVRNLAGYPCTGGSHESVHGYGDTDTLYAKDNIVIYVNKKMSGTFSGSGGLGSKIRNTFSSLKSTLRNIPTALMHSRTAKELILQAKDHEPVGKLCEFAIASRTSVLHPQKKEPIFGIRAEAMTGGQNDNPPVILRHIFMPLVDPDGTITGTRHIDAKTPNADIEALRAVIFCKLVMDQATSGHPVTLRKNLDAVESLLLDGNSKLKEYLTWSP